MAENQRSAASRKRLSEKKLLTVLQSLEAGDFTVRAPGNLDGALGEIALSINRLAAKNQALTEEMLRVSNAVASEGRLNERVKLQKATGAWDTHVASINSLIDELTRPTAEISRVIQAVAAGDLSQKITVEAKGEILHVKNTINKMVEQLRDFASEVTRVAKEVGTEGKLGAQADVPAVSGTWKNLTDNVNQLANNLTNQVRNIALVTKAVASGDLSQKITVEARGEIQELKDTINRMVVQLNSFADEVTRVAREVGTEGNLGGQAIVPGVDGTWKDLTDKVNVMAGNLTSQVRGIAKVVAAVAHGDLSQRLLLQAKGEIGDLADTINGMTDTLRVFADQVTTVAREVGIEGKLGGQAKVPGAAGTWRDLTDNVNQLAGNLTTQVRAIAEVATAVAKGDLTREIRVEAQGEVQTLKDYINQMIANLRDTTLSNEEQYWLKTNLAKFSGMMQGQRSIQNLSQMIMSELTPLVGAQHGALFVLENEGDHSVLKLISTYAYKYRKGLQNQFAIGEGLVGQVALEKKTVVVTDIPDEYIHISSGLGSATPRDIVVLPVLFEGRLKAVIELASFQHFSPIHLTFLEQLAQGIGVVFNIIGASTRTEELLLELQKSNQTLEGRSKELEDKASLLELRNREIAKASANLEEKARELSKISKYKTDFLANMSHELRTPLNSLLILAKMLSDNEEKALPPKYADYARTIYNSGRDLLALINEILDLSKVEAGKMRFEKRTFLVTELLDFIERTFRPVAKQKNLEFSARVAPDFPKTLTTDIQRLQQIIKNILSNAFKFTQQGHVNLDIHSVRGHLDYKSASLKNAEGVVAISISDTGIGIPSDKQVLIWDAFQQADTTTSRKYGGTGLGLAISRELASLLGGEIWMKSTPGAGSTFTLFLPLEQIESEVIPSTHDIMSATLPPASSQGSTEALKKIDLSGKKVLIIDDDPRNLFVLTTLLERQGAEVSTAESGPEGIEFLKKKPEIDLILMDIMMPGMDGYQATQEIRQMEKFGSLPIVALTAKAMPEEREKSIVSGCSDFVTKPVENERLLTVIQRWIEQAGDRSERASPAQAA